jgi:hypothetical protein
VSQSCCRLRRGWGYFRRLTVPSDDFRAAFPGTESRLAGFRPQCKSSDLSVSLANKIPTSDAPLTAVAIDVPIDRNTSLGSSPNASNSASVFQKPRHADHDHPTVATLHQRGTQLGQTLRVEQNLPPVAFDKSRDNNRDQPVRIFPFNLLDLAKQGLREGAIGRVHHAELRQRESGRSRRAFDVPGPLLFQFFVGVFFGVAAQLDQVDSDDVWR